MRLQIAVAIYNRMSLCSLPRHTDIHIQYTYMHTTLYLRIPRKALAANGVADEGEGGQWRGR